MGGVVNAAPFVFSLLDQLTLKSSRIKSLSEDLQISSGCQT